ncbi:MAG: hypothetical protein V4509_01870 [Patescibacteria group bacterium]
MAFVTWTLQDIEQTARQISGQLSATQLSSEQLDFFINAYYQYDLPRKLKIEEFYVQYTFPLEQNVSTYTLPGDFTDGLAFTHVEPKLYVNGVPIRYTQDTDVFYGVIPANFSTEQVGVGNGVTTSFNYTTNFQPIVSGFPSSVMVAVIPGQTNPPGIQEQLVDDGFGILDGDGTGTVNYISGAISVTPTTIPAVNSTIEVTYHFEQVGRPNTVLFYNRQFIFYPTPDTLYQGRIDAFKQPLALVDPTDVPLKPEWGEIIAIGAAMKILRAFGQYDKYKEVETTYFKEEWSKLMSDTDNQLMASRSPPRC